MPAFAINAIDRAGVRRFLREDAPSEAILRVHLRAQSLWPVRIREVPADRKLARLVLPATEFIGLLHQLELQLRAGVNADTALGQLAADLARHLFIGGALERHDERRQVLHRFPGPGVEFLVLDELHTYRGRQGADVALLVRRLRERLQALPAGRTEVWVTHQVNMTGLTGAYPGMGEGFLVDRQGRLLARGDLAA